MFEPILTTVSPVIVPAQREVSYHYYQYLSFHLRNEKKDSSVPEMMTIFLSSPATAEVKASRVLTVVVGPPEPPVVLVNPLSEFVFQYWIKFYSPSIERGIAERRHIVD